MTDTGSDETLSENGYLPLRVLAQYTGLSVRTLRGFLSHSVHPLPHYRIGGKILVRRSEYDRWVAQFHVKGSTRLREVVDEIIGDWR